ncbi:unnamed protein product [Caenorhabditis auriculariae]|uniref:Uncharacterized protein n=1 Tax=Caenorhabditis auriculariae TaxID=2777116 RepID=A0A8S1GPN6_9PELO|nr:unnamed protein product [Caenorhabditis auriculariae]
MLRSVVLAFLLLFAISSAVAQRFAYNQQLASGMFDNVLGNPAYLPAHKRAFSFQAARGKKSLSLGQRYAYFPSRGR